MDPENRRAAELLGEGSPLPPKEPVLPPVGVLPAGFRTPAPARPEAKPLVSPAPAEPAEIETLEEQPREEAVPAPPEEAPAWLEEIAPPAEAAPTLVFLPEEEMPAEEAEAPAAEPAIPEWLAEFSAPTAPAAEEELPAEAVTFMEEPAPPLAPEALEEIPPAGPVEEAEAPAAPEDLRKLAAELPEELRALVEEAMAREITPPAAPAGKAAEVELPPWLAEMAEEAEHREEVMPALAEEEEIPAWLRELAQKEIAAEAPAEEHGEEAVLPWLESRLEEAEPAEAGIPAGEEAPVEEIPEWLQRLRQAAIQDMPLLESELAAGEEILLEQETGVPAHELELTPAAEEAPPEEEISTVVSASMLEEIWMAAAEGMPLIHEEEIAPVPQALEAGALAAEEVPAPAEETAPAAAEERETPAPVEAAEAPAVEELPSPSPFITQAQERLRVRPDDHEMRLALARAWRDAGQIESALQEYSALVEADQFVESIVSDLERLIAGLEEGMEFAPAWTVLGDAYMRQGRLSDALDAYRRALGRKPA
ncbi:MAG: tetratricopeptide repeat protein, partial [Anaerolineae bacterium]